MRRPPPRHALRHVTLSLVDGTGGDPRRWVDARRMLRKVDGVQVVFVNPRTEMAYVEFDSRLADPARLITTVERTGLRVAQLQRR